MAWLAAVIVLTVVVAPSVFAQAKTGAGGPAFDAAKLAALRMEVAGMKLAKVRALAAQGKASEADVAAAERDVEEAAEAVERAAGEGGGPKITVEIKDATLDDALRAIFKDTEQSVVVQSGIIVGSPVNLSLKNVPLEDAVKAVTQLYGLQYTRAGNIWLISQQPGMVSVGGAHVPLLGALPDVRGDRVFVRRVGGVGDETLLFLDPRIVRETGSGSAGVDFPGSETLVDLEVEDAPLSEVAAKLSAAVNATLEKQAKEQEDQARASAAQNQEAKERGIPVGIHYLRRERVELRAHESVGDVRVTARVYRWPAGQLLGMLIDQARLVHTSQAEQSTSPDPELEGAFWQTTSTTIYLVPQPVLEVTGATSGVRAEGER
jgi:hypothetical protein